MRELPWLKLLLFRADEYVGLVGFANVGAPSITTAEIFAKAAAAKAAGQPVHLSGTGSATGTSSLSGAGA